MIHTARTVRTLQAVAMSLGIAILLWSTGLPTMFHKAEAASISLASDTLSTSQPGVAANHTIRFTTSNGLSTGQYIELSFQNTFPAFSVGVPDVDLIINGVSTSTAVTSAAGVWGVSTTTSTIRFTTPTGNGVASSSNIVIHIGSQASTSGSGTTVIVNPTATTSSHYIDIGGTMQDSGQVRVAIVDQVTMSASVDSSLTFTVSGVNSSSTVNGSPTTTAATTTHSTLPFGLLGINSSKTLAQDLTVTTNAYTGYTVTVVQAGDFDSTTGAVIDGFVDGSYTTTPAAWQGPSAVVSNTATYGHWGLTSSDSNILARTSQFGSDQWVSGSTTPVAIMGHNGPVLATTTRVGYQVQISALQEAGDDYETQLRYIATPVF